MSGAAHGDGGQKLGGAEPVFLDAGGRQPFEQARAAAGVEGAAGSFSVMPGAWPTTTIQAKG